MYPAETCPCTFKTLLPLLLSALILLLAAPCHGKDPEAQFREGTTLLVQGDFEEKHTGIQKIAASGDQRAETLFLALLDGKLFHLKKDKTLVYATLDNSQAEIKSVLSGETLGTVSHRKIKKITINNSLRSQLKDLLAKIDLKSADARIRTDAVNKLMLSLSPASSSLLTELLETESNSDVREALTTAMAIVDLRSLDSDKKLLALGQLQGNLKPAVRNELQRLLSEEKDINIRSKAESVLSTIETKTTLYGLVETLFFGLSLGSVLVLAAIGLAITFGVIGVINMAHGELIMLGAYTTYVIQQLLPGSIGIALFLSIPAAFLVSGLTGIAIERLVIRFLYGRPLETLLATFGVSLILQQAVRSIFSPLNRSVASPAWMSGSWQLNPILSLTTNRITILVFSLLVFTGLYLLLKKSSIGLQVRAVAQNRNMARAMGIRAAKVDALTFGLGSGIAGIAGVALSQLTNVGPNLGQAYIIDSFMVVVFGGVGNLWGTLIGGLSLGVANKFLEPWAGAVLAKILILVFIILFIQKRPQGLFPQKGRAAG
ncbi:MAG: urea ABC transporter permease subunit UrtB [Proteobacteria bacterium]|nr:urea ABC transporter permease subunit UrtB [Pseudomonadota bacterium]MBU1060072.1 urea ABC transporter permease subunit UrtB [Pseudomonadota bacterium]